MFEPTPKPLLWPRRIGPAIAVWTAFWAILITGYGGLNVLASINDDHMRARLAQHGQIAEATIAGQWSWEDEQKHSCGKGRHAIVRFTPIGQNLRTFCVSSDALPDQFGGYAGVIPMQR